jgi:hypothetical protein
MQVEVAQSGQLASFITLKFHDFHSIMVKKEK